MSGNNTQAYFMERMQGPDSWPGAVAHLTCYAAMACFYMSLIEAT